MEISKTEIAAVQDAAADHIAPEHFTLLADMELVLVGGGAGDVVFA